MYIKCKDTSGRLMENSFRNDSSNAIVFSADNKYKNYIKEKENKEKMIWMENKISELTAIVNSLIKMH